MTDAAITVLVVDDDDMLREVLTEQLLLLGYRVATAASAAAAMGMLRDGAEPDLVLTDVNLGGTTGVELCRWIKAQARLAVTPVILFSGSYEIGARSAGLAAGADDFFPKPFVLAELHSRIAELIATRPGVREPS